MLVFVVMLDWRKMSVKKSSVYWSCLFYIPILCKVVKNFKMSDRGVFAASKIFVRCLHVQSLRILKNTCEGKEAWKIAKENILTVNRHLAMVKRFLWIRVCLSFRPSVVLSFCPLRPSVRKFSWDWLISFFWNSVWC